MQRSNPRLDPVAPAPGPRRARPRSRLRTILLRALLAAVVSPLLAFLLLEAAARIAGNADFHGVDYVMEDPELQWSDRPGQRSEIVGFDYRYRISFNSLGLRGPEPRAGAVTRVLMLGDSYTLGLGVNDEEAACAQLQRRLDLRAPGRFDVQNAGVAGYGVLQATGLARRVWDRLRPSIVIWTHVGNDFSDDWNFKHGSWSSLRTRIPGRRFLLENSSAWSLIKPGALLVLGALKIRESPIRMEGKRRDTVVSSGGPRATVGRDLTLQGLDALAALCAERGARLFVTTASFDPAEQRLVGDGEIVREHCSKQGIAFLAPPRSGSDRPLESWVNRNSIAHWSPAANEWFAEALLAGIEAHGGW